MNETIDDLKQQRKELLAEAQKLAIRIGDLEFAQTEHKRLEIEMPVSIDVKRIQNAAGTWGKWMVLGTIPPRVVDAQKVIDLMSLGE